VPIVAVLGNHDWHAGKQREIEQVMVDAGVHVLDGEAYEVLGIGFAGVKGFGGGFGRHTLEPWGEETIKRFVMEAIEQTLKLETALARVHVPQRIAVLHYAPIRATVEGEPPEIFPFLGSSRLEEPLNRIPVTAVLHGHAHHGAPEGRTRTNTPVYNVSMPLLRSVLKGQPPVRLLEIPIEPTPEANGKESQRSSEVPTHG
jgi:Icc-related predicted phosphoesterase